MRSIYLDEAGRSNNEPLTVVAGIIADAEQDVAARLLLAKTLGTVPPHLQQGFIAHATDIWNDAKLRDKWPFEERLRFVKAVASIPRRLDIPVCLAMTRRENP
jgi:hypothetical protein